MTNYEFYKDEIIEAIAKSESCSFKAKYVFKTKCCNIDCDSCCSCNSKTKEWFNSEYKEPIKLTQTEYHILKGLDNKWKYIVRNAVDDDIAIHTTKPYKAVDCDGEDMGVWDNYDDIFDMPYNHLFTFIKWEDEEPRLIEELLKYEVIDNE